MKSLHERLRESALVGPFSKTSDPNFVEAMGCAGMDFIILDLEHGPNDIVNLGPLIRAAEASGMVPVVRTLKTDQIGRAFDLGARAVQVPHIGSAAEAAAAVRAARFAPEGQRGVCRYVRAAKHGTMDKATYFGAANASVTVIAQVEGRQGLENLPEILQVPGVDVIFLGVYDLSQSLGFTGQVDRPEVEAALREVVRQSAARGIPVGTFVENPATARRYREMGVHYLCYSVDVGILATACHGVVSDIRAG